MTSTTQSPPLTLGLFEKRLAGDDALLELASLRFRQARMGAEIHAGTPTDLESALRFRPTPEAAVVVHLPRDFHLGIEGCRARILELAGRFAGRVHGFVLHDHPDLAARPEAYRDAAQSLDTQLSAIANAPWVFVEYAAGLEPESFASFFSGSPGWRKLSACIDVGHVGIRQCQRAYAASHLGEDICRLRFQPSRISEALPDIEAAVRTALPAVLELVRALGPLPHPVHFHLHDGHPLSTFSPFGVSDHLSFLRTIPLTFEYRGHRSVPLMFGTAGLSHIVHTALEAIRQQRASFTLEIHPQPERLPLDAAAAALFQHWRDKTHAEQTNQWLAVLAKNHELLLEACRAARSQHANNSGIESSAPLC